MYKGWTYDELKDAFSKAKPVYETEVCCFHCTLNQVDWSGMYKRKGDRIVIMYDPNGHAFLNDNPPLPAGLKVVKSSMKILQNPDFPRSTDIIFSWQIEGWSYD